MANTADSLSQKDDFDRFQRLISNTSWTLFVQAVFSATGLSLRAKYDVVSCTTPAYSLACRLGHRTLFSFVTSPLEECGLGLDWSDWLTLSKAYEYRYEHNFSGTPDEILSTMSQVKKKLSTIPEQVDNSIANEASKFEHKDTKRIDVYTGRVSISGRNVCNTPDSMSRKLNEYSKLISQQRACINSQRQLLLKQNGELTDSHKQLSEHKWLIKHFVSENNCLNIQHKALRFRYRKLLQNYAQMKTKLKRVVLRLKKRKNEIETLKRKYEYASTAMYICLAMYVFAVTAAIFSK